MTEIISNSLDSTDLRILRILQKNCKTSLADISRIVGKGITTVHSRIKAMENQKIIQAYRAVLDPAALQRPTLAYILITIRYRVPGREEVISQREFCREIAQHPFVQEVHVLSGQFDVLLKVRTKDVYEINSFIVDFLRELPAVERTLTMFTMDTFLETTEIRPHEQQLAFESI